MNRWTFFHLSKHLWLCTLDLDYSKICNCSWSVTFHNAKISTASAVFLKTFFLIVFLQCLICHVVFIILFWHSKDTLRGLIVLSFHNRIRNQLHSAPQLVQQWKKPFSCVIPCSHISTHSSITHTSVGTQSPHHCSFSKKNAKPVCMRIQS